MLEIDGGNLFALRGLERVYEVLNDWPDLVEVLERQLDVVETERERVEVLLKLAKIQEEQFLKPDVAAQRLEQVLEIVPTEERAYVALERCYRRLKQWLDLINTYERHISEARGHADQGRALRRDRPGLRRRGRRRRPAIDAYQNIVDLDDTNIAGARSAQQALREAGRRGAGDRRR